MRYLLIDSIETFSSYSQRHTYLSIHIITDHCEPLRIKSFCTDDTLDVQVAALPPEYTSRFGEVVWAHGGAGWGFWPSIVYDPRLTIGGARKLALKHVGKKHLVYFFGCSDAPFTVLNDPKLIPWEEGLLDEYDLGKTAKAIGKTRAIMFEWALQAAMVEHEKPIEHRLDWNHEEDQLIVEGSQRQTRSSNTTSTGSKETSDGHKRPSSRVDDSNSVHGSSSVEVTSNNRSKPSTSSSADVQDVNKSRRRSKTPQHVPSYNDDSNSSSDFGSNTEKREYFCRIMLMDQAKNNQLIGFVTLPKGQSTFYQLRTIISKEIDDLPSKWKFSLQTLGPVSIKQEKKFGPMLGSLDGNIGSSLNPLDVFLHSC